MSDYLVAPERCEGEGFVLRSYRPGDGPLLQEATNASFSHLVPWMPWASATQTVSEAERLAREFRGRWLLASDFTLAILDPAEEVLLGGCGFHLRDSSLALKAAEIGMWIRASAAGQGLGTRVLRALLTWGFGPDWGWERLTWRCDARNEASRRTAEKAGLCLEGTLLRNERGTDGALRDTLLFAALTETRGR